MNRTGKLNRYFLLTFFLLLSSLSLSAFGAPTQTQETQAQEETEPNIAPAGEVRKVEGAFYLYDVPTNKPVTGKTGVLEYPAGSGSYYFLKDKKGQVYVKTWIKVGDDFYRADKKGCLMSGFCQIGKRLYYFNPKTLVRARAGWKTVDKKRYYFSDNGTPRTGFLKLKNRTYYLDPAENGAKTTGWKKISGKWYYFGAKGKMRTGLVKIGTKTYYFSSRGVRKTGLRTLNGSRYYFNKKKNGAMTTGWVTHKNKRYYFGSSGKAVTGWLNLKNKKYYFSAKGVMQKGWLTQGGRKYYLSPQTGAMLTGKQTIDGKTYDFGTKGYLSEPTGPWSIKVNQGTCVVTVYRGSTPVKAMLCSVGLNGATKNGTFTLGQKRHWHALFGGVWGQYTSVITGNILFHSVYYYRYKDNNSLATAEFNKLGSPASHGCVRLSCADAYYIYVNCPSYNTTVTVFTGTAADDPLGRPAKRVINTNYDPTDPNPYD